MLSENTVGSHALETWFQDADIYLTVMRFPKLDYQIRSLSFTFQINDGWLKTVWSGTVEYKNIVLKAYRIIRNIQENLLLLFYLVK